MGEFDYHRIRDHNRRKLMYPHIRHLYKKYAPDDDNESNEPKQSLVSNLYPDQDINFSIVLIVCVFNNKLVLLPLRSLFCYGLLISS